MSRSMHCDAAGREVRLSRATAALISINEYPICRRSKSGQSASAVAMNVIIFNGGHKGLDRLGSLLSPCFSSARLFPLEAPGF